MLLAVVTRVGSLGSAADLRNRGIFGRVHDFRSSKACSEHATKFSRAFGFFLLPILFCMVPFSMAALAGTRNLWFTPT